MAQITAAIVKELRERTGAGMMDCKKALVATEGDMEKAIDFLREKGLSQAAKKAGRVAAEGAVVAYVTEDGKTGAIVEVNCQDRRKHFRSSFCPLRKRRRQSVQLYPWRRQDWCSC